MVIINPNNTKHTIYIIPRYYNIDNPHTFSIKNNNTTVSVTPSVVRTIDSGYISYEFDLVTTEGVGYDIKITDSVTTNVVWRGKMFATTQVTQQYKING